MKQCEKGHFYDEARYKQCPYCMPASAPAGSTAAVDAGLDIGKTVAASAAPAVSDSGKTVGLIQKKLGIDPAVGFLVCIEGAQKGEDFRLVAGRNHIGRAQEMDVRLDGDEAVSRESHAVVVYDVKSNAFYAVAGTGRGITYLNGAILEQMTPLHSGDELELGGSRLLFLPLCSERFRWA